MRVCAAAQSCRAGRVPCGSPPITDAGTSLTCCDILQNCAASTSCNPVDHKFGDATIAQDDTFAANTQSQATYSEADTLQGEQPTYSETDALQTELDKVLDHIKDLLESAKVASLNDEHYSKGDDRMAHLTSQLVSANLIARVVDLEKCHGLTEHQLAYQVAAELMRGQYSVCRYKDPCFPPSDESLYPGGICKDSSDTAAKVATIASHSKGSRRASRGSGAQA